MNDPNEMYPHDQTGFGPTGTGNAPTAQEERLQRSNRFRTSRLSRAAQLMDPATIAKVAAARQAVHGNANLDEQRRSIFETSGGQAAMDMAFMARRVGNLGYGDPVNFAANVGQGVASGGFNTQIGGIDDAGVPTVGSPGATKGMGPISERVSAAFMKGIIENIYGGDTNPSNNYGFDMEETSQVFQTLASRGIIGDVAHVERNATITQRLEEGGKAAFHPAVRKGISDALEQVKSAGDTDEERNAELTRMIEDETTSPLLKKELQAIQARPNAIAINDKEVKRVSEINKEVVKGLAALSDMYGELSAPDALMKLEAISGTRITSRGQARQATAMVEELRQAAIAGGMDPAAYIKFSGDVQASRQAEVSQVMGTDSRTSAVTKSVTAALHNQTMTDAMYESQVMQREVEAMRANGMSVPDAPSANEIAEDKWQGVMKTSEQYKGYALALGGRDSLTTENQALVDVELDKIRNEKGDTEASRAARYSASQRMLRIFQDQNTGADGVVPTAEEMLSQRDVKGMLGEGLKTSEFGKFTTKARTADTNFAGVRNKLEDNVGKEAADKVFDPIKDKLGAGGLTELLKISKDNSGGKLKRMDDLMSELDMTEEEKAAIKTTFFDESGRSSETSGGSLLGDLKDVMSSDTGNAKSMFSAGSILDISKDKEGNKRERMLEVLSQSGLSKDAADEVISSSFNKSGQLRDAAMSKEQMSEKISSAESTLTTKNILDIADDDAGDKRERMREVLTKSGITGDAAEKLLDDSFDKSGKVKPGGVGSKKRKGLEDAITGLHRQRNEATSLYGRREAAQMELDSGDKNGLREKIRDDKNRIGLSGIANAMLEKDSDFNSPESVALALEAFKNEEIAVEAIVDGEKVDLTDKFTSGIDFSKGLTAEGLKSLDAANGGDMELWKKLKDPATGKGFKNRDDMIEASKNNPELINNALRTIRTDEDYTGFSLTGGASNMTAMGDDVVNAAKGVGLQKKIKAMAGARLLARQQGLKEDETSNLIKTAGDNEPGVDISQYRADTAPGGRDYNPFNDDDIQAGSGLKNQLALADTFAASSNKDMEMFAATFEDSDILGEMDKQKKKLMERQKVGGGEDIIKVGQGKEAKETTVDAAIDKLDKSMKKLSDAMAQQDGAQIVKKMYVTDVVVEGNFNPNGGE